MTIQLRRDTAANWTSNDPTLAAGELGLESDTGRIKYGDGSTAWTSLGYAFESVNLVGDTTPQLGGMLDVNGQAFGDGTLELMDFSETASAVNHVRVTNAATTGAPSLSAVGDDTNINLNLVGKGTGVVTAGGVAVVTLTGTQTLTNKTLTSPKIAHPITTDADNYTLVAGDQSGIVIMSSGSANQLTIPTNASVAFPTGTKVEVWSTGAGTTTIAGDTGVTLQGNGGSASAGSCDIQTQYGGATLTKIATDTWMVGGDIDAVA